MENKWKKNTNYGVPQKLRHDSKEIPKQNVYHIKLYADTPYSAKYVHKRNRFFFFSKGDDHLNRGRSTGNFDCQFS